jgi:hypothetical protein
MKSGLLLVAGVVALWAYSKAHTGTHLQFLPLNASWDGGSLHVQIGVQNPTNDSLQLQSLAGTVAINGTTAGNISDFTPALIAPNAQTPITLSYTPSIFGIVSTVVNQLNNGGPINITVNGTANVNGIPLPVNLTFQALTA